MSSLNSEKSIREDLISKILQSEYLNKDENYFQYHLKTNSAGEVQSISPEGTDFLIQHFGLVLKVGDILFDIVPTESLKEFLVCFKDALDGISSGISFKGISSQQIKFHLNSIEDRQIVEIDISISQAEYNRNTIPVNTSQEMKTLNETSQVFESLFNNHPDAVYSFDLKGNFISANESACKMAEISNSELLKHSFLPLIPEKDQEMVLNHFLNAVKGEFQNYNTGMRGFKGTEIIINITNFPIIINGKITGVFGIAKDITQIELNKAHALHLEKRYKTILDQSLDVICTIDKDGCFVHINEVCYEMWGYKPEELYGKPYMEFVVREDWETTTVAAQEIMSGENKTNFSNRYLKKDGSVLPMVWSARWVEEEQLMYCIAKNASEMNAVKNKLEEERNILRAIIDNIPDYIFVKNKNNEVILANKKFYSDYLGKNNESEILGRKPTDYFSRNLGEEIIEDNIQVMENDLVVINRKDVVYDHEGKKEIILLTKVPFKTKKGDVIGLVGIARNVTENYEFEQEQLLISKLNEALGAAENLQKGLFETIQIISEYFDFGYAEAWEVGLIDDRLKNIAIYQPNTENFLNSEKHKELQNSNIPKKILELREIKIWKGDLFHDDISNSITIGVPIIFDKKVIQILTFRGSTHNRSLGLLKDIFHRIRIQIASGIQRKITESQLNNLFKNSPTLITVIGLDGYMKKVSPSFTKIFGFSEEELLSTAYKDFLHPDETNISFERLKEIAKGYTPKSFEGRCKTKNGEWKWISWTPSEIISDDGIISLFGLDITDRKDHEKELKKYNDQVNNILESITDGFFSVTNDWIVTYWNKEAENLLRVNKEVLLGNNLWDHFADSKDSLTFTKYAEAMETGKKVSFQDYFETYDTWFEVNAYPSETGLSVYFKDITIKKRIDEEIKNAKERYDLVTKVTHEAIYDWDLIQNSMEWSDAYATSFGYPIPSLENGLEHWEHQLHADDKEKVVSSLNAALYNSSANFWEHEYKLVKANNDIAIVIDRGLITRNKKGIPIRMIGSLQDISELKQNEIALEKLNFNLKLHADELALSNAELEQFAYIASHDLQEPLRMVTSFLTQLNKKYKAQLDPKAQQYIYYATDGAVRMRQILLDLLEYSRVGKMDYDLEEIDLNLLLKDIIKLHRDLIGEVDGEILYNKLPVITAAKSPIQRVISNLITNALKYQKKDNKPFIKISVIEDEEFWEVRVSDNGIGIDEQFFDKIFVVFQRLHSKDEYSGTGIGLAICRKIIENHGGKIWVSSKINEGSTFHITIKKQN